MLVQQKINLYFRSKSTKKMKKIFPILSFVSLLIVSIEFYKEISRRKRLKDKYDSLRRLHQMANARL